MFIKKLFQHVIHHCACRLRYWKHEFTCWKNGDTRKAFKKKVDRCRYLELGDLIHNAG